MITTSTTYNTIFADPSHYAETKIVVGNTTYDENTIMACERTQTLFSGYYDIGNTVINQITFTLIGVTADELPRMSRVVDKNKERNPNKRMDTDGCVLHLKAELRYRKPNT